MVEIIKGEYNDIAHKVGESCLVDSTYTGDVWVHGGTISLQEDALVSPKPVQT